MRNSHVIAYVGLPLLATQQNPEPPPVSKPFITAFLLDWLSVLNHGKSFHVSRWLLNTPVESRHLRCNPVNTVARYCETCKRARPIFTDVWIVSDAVNRLVNIGDDVVM